MEGDDRTLEENKEHSPGGEVLQSGHVETKSVDLASPADAAGEAEIPESKKEKKKNKKKAKKEKKKSASGSKSSSAASTPRSAEDKDEKAKEKIEDEDEALAEDEDEDEDDFVDEEFPDISRVVGALRRTFNKGKTQSLDWRKDQLKALRDLFVENEEQILEALAQDLGRCRMESVLSEISTTVAEIDLALRNLKTWAHPQRVSTPLAQMKGLSHSEIHKQPLGVVLIIAPWNYPINLCLAPLVGALAAGNAALLKPSELSKHSSHLLAELVPKYLDPEAVRVIEGAVAETTAILRHKFDHIFYTGSTSVGKVVMRAAAEHLTPVTLELGGKSPCIIDSKVDIDPAVRRVVWGKFWNAGQTCIAPDYLLVHEDVKEEFVEKLKEVTREFYGEDPKESKDFARIISTNHVKRLSSYLDEVRGRDDVTILNDKGGEVEESERYVAPTLVLCEGNWIKKGRGGPLDAKLMSDEIFGPILPIFTIKSLDEAVRFINKRPHPLALYLFSKNSANVDLVLKKTISGGAMVNDTIMHFTVHSLPFGGVGDSGIGAYHGQASFDVFSHHKSVLNKTTKFDLSVRYPPYSDNKLSFIQMLA